MREQNLGRGHHIVGFDSFEEMGEYLKEQERETIAETLLEQWQINWGDRVIRVEGDLTIFGHVFTWDEFLTENAPASQEQEEELLLELEGIKDAHRRGYRYGKWYSEVEPDGEYGSAHVVSLWRITKDDFEVARRNEWHPWPELILRVQGQIQAAHTRKEEGNEVQQDHEDEE